MTSTTTQEFGGQQLGDRYDIARKHLKLLREIDRYDVSENPKRITPERRAVRALAKAIIEGRKAWPRDLIPWKEWRELTFNLDGRGVLPPWEDERNLTPPQREQNRRDDDAARRRMARERARRPLEWLVGA
ncbi:hypothetical protein [Terricaulis sp.]|uniref:hypothetical protein n=1 Tax=Terricaulis sp. TaxID=2768686 RepID=UPI003785269E